MNGAWLRFVERHARLVTSLAVLGWLAYIAGAIASGRRFRPGWLFTLFLIVVASWRVALLVYYLKWHAQLKPTAIFVSTMLPITGIIVTLTILNLERATFVSMGGFREEPTVNDSAYGLLSALTLLSMLLLIPLLICYMFLVVNAQMSVDE